MTKHFLLFILIFTFSTSAFPQKFDFVKKLFRANDTSYVYHFPHRIMITPTFFYRTNNFKLTDVDGVGNDIIYKPNTPIKIGLSASYKWLKLGFAFNMPSYTNSIGETKTFGLYLNTQTKFMNWGLDFYIVKNTGYYLANPELNIPGWTDRNEYPFRSDIKALNIGLFTHMVFSKKFSLKAALQQTEKQIKSAGGFGIQSGISFSGISSDSTIIPYSQQDFYGGVTQFTKGSFVSLHVRPGYAYTYVYNDFYATAIAHVGLGLQIQSYKMNGQHWGLKLSPTFKYQMVFGYNVNDYFMKFLFAFDTSSFSINKVKFRNGFVTASISGGIRIL